MVEDACVCCASTSTRCWDQGGHANLSLHYRFDEEAAWDLCGAYAVDAGLTAGCALGVRDDIMYLTLRDGGWVLLNLSRYVADFRERPAW
ncbi:cytokine receptor-like factor 2 [Dipodomys merriami]|uniref:cytokine receptor-like factor 2 n=1 Tax=Dipodomys merriami TaxID=94247 RepID=UPI00385608A9